jgi:hypothetical protein
VNGIGQYKQITMPFLSVLEAHELTPRALEILALNLDLTTRDK